MDRTIETIKRRSIYVVRETSTVKEHLSLADETAETPAGWLANRLRARAKLQTQFQRDRSSLRN